MATKPTRKLKPPLAPMESKAILTLPVGPNWQFEPKWDGFRCLVFRDGDSIFLQSKSGQPLARYFPDLVEGFAAVKARRFVLDGEIVIPVEGRFSFDQLLMRIHPAQSRVAKLASEFPAMFIAFDLLEDDRGKSLLDQPLPARRKRLETFVKKYLRDAKNIELSPATTSAAVARRWFEQAGGNLDGIMAKKTDLPYRSGLRDGMVKVKHHRTADCVVGGFRYSAKGRTLGSLLLGLYNDRGLLDHVGFTASFTAPLRREIMQMIKPLRGGSGFTGRAPDGPSRWSKRDAEWKPLTPSLVVEVQYDHFTGDRFRHGTKLVRFRPDKSPKQCTFDQIEHGTATLTLLRRPVRT